MNRIGFALAMVAVVGMAAWAYHVNYLTKTALTRIEALRGMIAAEREALEVLRVEWAYLNAPGRLSALVRRHRGELGLVPLSPANFDEVASIPYPAVAEPADPVAEPGTAGPVAATAQAGMAQLAAAQFAPVPAPRPGGRLR